MIRLRRKRGYGNYYHRDGGIRSSVGNPVKGGDILEVNALHEVPQAFRDGFDILDDTPEAKVVDKGMSKAEEQDAKELPRAALRIAARRDGMFDVVNENGDPVNDMPLDSEQAEAFLEVRAEMEAEEDDGDDADGDDAGDADGDGEPAPVKKTKKPAAKRTARKTASKRTKKGSK